MNQICIITTKPAIKIYTVISVIIFAAIPVLFAQSGTLGLVNESGGTAYIISLPTEQQQYSKLQENPLDIPGLIRQNSSRARSIPPGGMSRRVPAFRQETMIIGYVYKTGSLRHPVILMKIPPDAAGRLFLLDSAHIVYDSSGSMVTVSSSEDLLPGAGSQKIDGRIVDWINISDTLRYSSGFNPQRIRRESPGTTTEIPASDSLFLQRGGTGLDRVKFDEDDFGIYGMISSHQQIVNGMSFIMQFFPRRNEENTNSHTLEVPVAGQTGHVVLWGQDGSSRIAGSYHKGEFFLEFIINRDLLPVEMVESLSGRREGSFDISTGFTDGQVYEEFLFGTLPAAGLISR